MDQYYILFCISAIVHMVAFVNLLLKKMMMMMMMCIEIFKEPKIELLTLGPGHTETSKSLQVSGKTT